MRASTVFRRLLPAYVAAVETWEPGDPGSLLPAEAACLRSPAPKRLREFAAGRSCARRALAQLGVGNFAVTAGPDRQPRWPEHVVGSITHTDGFCAAVVADRASCLAIGIDSEVAGSRILNLAHRICVPAEREWVESLPPADRPSAATLIFSAKEAFYKCQYPLVADRVGFQDLQVVGAGDWAAEGEERDPADFSIHFLRPLVAARLAAAPIRGRYLRHGGLVSAAVCLAAVPGPPP